MTLQELQIELAKRGASLFVSMGPELTIRLIAGAVVAHVVADALETAIVEALVQLDRRLALAHFQAAAPAGFGGAP